MLHRESPLTDRHAAHNWEYANAADRTAVVSGFFATDVNKFALDLDTGKYWRLSSITPITWVEFGAQGIPGPPGASGSGTGDMLGANNLLELTNIVTAKTKLHLENVDNTSDANKPVSTAQAAAIAGVTASSLGLGNVNNTSDANKPVSTAQAAADAAILTSAQTYANGLVVGLWDDRGSFNASVNTYPTTGGSGSAGAILKGDIWTISVIATSGVLLGYAVGTTVRAVTDTPGQTAGNWSVSAVGLGYVPENAANKNTSGGYAGLTLYKLNLKNALGTITSWFSTAATVARTWTMPDKDGTVAMTSDITGTNSGTNTGDQTSIVGITGTLAQFSTACSDDDLVGVASAATLANKRITNRVGSTTSTATPAINTDNYDVYKLTALAVDITDFTMTGTPADKDPLIVEITGTAARAITWGSSFEASTAALPTTTVGTAMLSVGFLWNSTTSKWRCMGAV